MIRQSLGTHLARLAAALLALALVATACAPAGPVATPEPPAPGETPAPPPGETPAPPDETPTPPDETPAPPDERPFEGMTLNVLTFSYHDEWEFGVPGITDAFEEATGATINPTFIPDPERSLHYARIIATQDATYDLVLTSNFEGEGYSEILFENIEDKIDQAILDDMTKYTTYQGEGVYVLPILDGVSVLYWNLDHVEQAGLGRDWSPRTWDDVFEACEAIHTTFPDRFCMDLPAADSYALWEDWSVMLATACGQMYSDDLRSTAFNDERGAAALEVFKRWHDVSDPGSLTLTSSFRAQERLAQEISSISFGYSDEYVLILTDPEWSTITEWGMGMMPGTAGCETGATDGWEGYGVSRFGDPAKKELAYAYLEWLVSNEVQTIFANEIGFLPVRRALGENPPPEIDAPPTWPIAIETMERGVVDRFGSPFAFQVADVWNEVIRRYWAEELTTQQALDELDRQTQEVIDNYWSE